MKKFIEKLFIVIKKNRYIQFGLVFCFGILLLRLYQIGGYAMFLGDQGRDAIIIKRILTFEHFPAIGAPTSIGQIFLGPFYYYFMAPWLLIFIFNPVGLAIGVAITSIILLFTIYILIYYLFDKKYATPFVVLSGVSVILFTLSRYSWNPNLLPYFSFLVFLVLMHLIEQKKVFSAILLGALLSICVQLHYIALILIPAVVIVYVWQVIKVKQYKKYIHLALFSIFSFVFISTPLLIFDIRHNFLNSRNFIKLFTQGDAVSGSGKLESFRMVIESLINYALFDTNISYLGILLFAGLIILAVFTVLHSKIGKQFLLFFIILLFGLSLYSGPKYPHYISVVFLYFYFFIALIISHIKYLKGYVLWFLLILFSLYSLSQYDFMKSPPNNQISMTKKIAESIIPHITKNTFQITALPERYDDNSYRYFIEIKGKKPLDKDSTIQADELFVVCATKCPLIIGNPQWDIALFAPRKIVAKWTVENVTMYKLVR